VPTILHIAIVAFFSVNFLTSAVAQGSPTATSPTPERVDVLAHPVWGPALAAEAASVAADAPARSAAAAASSRALHGLSGWAQLRPSASWTQRNPDGGHALSASAGLSWRLDPVASASARLDQHRGDVAAHERALRSVRDLTSAYIALRRAHIAVDLAAAALPARQATLARAEAGHLAGSVSRTQRDLAALELERAEAALERAARDLNAAAHTATRLGLDRAAAAAHHLLVFDNEPFEGWRLQLPPLDLPHESLLRRALERELAAARLERRGGWALLDDIRLDASLTDQGARLRAGIGLDTGRPSAWADATWTGTTSEAWSIGVSARLRIDDSWSAERERAERALADADAALALALADAAWLAREAHRAVHEAADEVAFAERSLALSRQALRELAAELAAARHEARSASDAGDLSEAERSAAAGRVQRLEDAYRRAELGYQRERDAFLRSWERYLREAERLWAGVGWPFSVIEGGNAAE